MHRNRKQLSLCRAPWLLSVSSAILACCIAQGAAAEECAGPISQDNRTVIVTARREGVATHFFVENKELCDVTMTFDMNTTHMTGSVAFPFTTTFPPHQTVEAFCLSPDESGTQWDYSYTNYYKLGSSCAQHDDSFVYELPYPAGDKFKVTQAYNGKFSHTGSNQYATDWQMAEGTPVLAARGGLVIRVKDDSDRGGGSMDFDRFNNYVLIRHADGTLAHYCHLQKGGAVVKPGQTVVTGQLIAHSGNTGFSSGPHLHFCVFKTKNGKDRVSLPVRFRTATERAVTLVSGRSYRAVANVESATVNPVPSNSHAQGGGQ
jgi:hypothetical protein